MNEWMNEVMILKDTCVIYIEIVVIVLEWLNIIIALRVGVGIDIGFGFVNCRLVFSWSDGNCKRTLHINQSIIHSLNHAAQISDD